MWDMGKRTYEIPFVGLAPGSHQFEYDLDEKFFEEFQTQDFRDCKAKINLTLEKNTGFMLLTFNVGGNMKVNCDRCGNDLPIQLWDEFKLIIKMAENPEKMNEEEEDPDVYYIARTESHIEVKNWLYEFVTLSIPNQKMCTESEMGGPNCNKEVLQLLESLKVNDNAQNANSLWKGLDKFKNLDN
jgi:uncharacterized metal-binding protein YceD (DUF177 family)